MPRTYKHLFREFISGATDGQHRKIHIEPTPFGTRLVGYDHCVYAERESDTGRIRFFEGWTDSERATNASNIQAGYLRQVLDEQSMFHQVAKQERVDELRHVDGGSYDSFNVDAVPAAP